MILKAELMSQVDRHFLLTCAIACMGWEHNGYFKQANTRPFRTNTQKRCPFHYRGLECKVGSQETPGVTGKFVLGIQNEAGQRLIEFLPRKCTGHSKHPLPKTLHLGEIKTKPQLTT